MALIALMLMPGAASAADSIYWANEGDGGLVHFANLADGSNVSLLGGAPVGGQPCGVAIDPAAGKIYWTDFGNSAVRVADLNGSGVTDLATGESGACGVAVDHAAGKIYWADTFAGTIRAANLADVSGTAQTLVSGETFPTGVAIDPAAGKIYWANQAPFGGSGAIRGANLDGSSPATLVPDSRPIGVAVNPAAGTAGKIYWTSFNDGAIRAADLSGLDPATNVTDLVSGQNGPAGLAIDPGANRVYWANFSGQTIWSANLDGTGGAAQLVGAAGTFANFPALLKAPAFPRPAISGGAKTERDLTCQAQFAPDLLGAFLFRAPQTVAYQWLLNGSPISNATQATFTPTQSGDYTCTVTATNHAGTTQQTSPVKKVKVSVGKG